MIYVIKSKGRPNILRQKSYALLKRYSVPDKDINIFVSNEDDLESYCAEFPDANVHIGDEGVVGIDNFIVDFFPEGEEYIYMNDDIKSLHWLDDKDHTKYVLRECDFNDFCYLTTKLFSELRVHNLSYGGVYFCDNAMFMNNAQEMSFNLSIIIDGFSACINNKKIKLTKFPEINDNWFSDYEKSILHFRDRGGICRLNKYCFKGEFFGKKSPITTRTTDNHLICAQKMWEKYPNEVGQIKRKKNGWNSLIFKKIKHNCY